MTKNNARYTAARAVVKIDTEGAYSNLTVDSLLTDTHLSPKDKAFATAIIYGVIERKLTLEHILSRYVKKKTDKQVKAILMISLYQLLYMDSVPDSAAVNEGVKLAKDFAKTSAGSFINGVLRAFIRDNKQVFTQDEKLTDIQRLSVLYSASEELVKLLTEQYGKETAEQFLIGSLGAPVIYIRVNTLKTTPEKLIEKLSEHNIEAKPFDSEKTCLIIEKAGDLTALDVYKEGHFHIQDRASQICAKTLAPQPNDRILDVCSAPGGKAFTIAEMMENTGEITACDIYTARVGLIEQGAKRLGITNIKTEISDAAVLNETFQKFDRVLCDVPCSGIGIIRRKPEIKYKNVAEFAQLVPLQYKILKTSSEYVKQDGFIVYSTCTLNRMENGEVVSKFIEENPNFELVSQRTYFPDTDDCDGFFTALMRRIR